MKEKDWLPPALVTALTFAVFFGTMGYPWQLAFLLALAIGALVYSSLGTWKRMRRLARRPAARAEWSPGENEPPRRP